MRGQAPKNPPLVLLPRLVGEEPGALARMLPTIYVPVMEVVPLREGLETVKRLLSRVDWLVVSSPRGARLVAGIVRSAPWVKVAAVGPSTANALRSEGVNPSLVPDEYRGEALARRLLKEKPEAVLLARSKDSLPDPVKVLESHGVNVYDVPIYELVPYNRGLEAVARLADSVDYIAFTSPRIAREVIVTLRRRLGTRESFKPAAIGPTTARELRRLGFREVVVASQYTLEGLARAILDDWENVGRQRSGSTGSI